MSISMEFKLDLIDNGMSRMIYSVRYFTRGTTTEIGCRHTGVLRISTHMKRALGRLRGHFRQSS